MVECPSHHVALLTEMRRHYRLAVVSNFDYSPTCLAILEREGLAPLFETIVISDEVGLAQAEAGHLRDRARTDRVSARPRPCSWGTGPTST